MNWADLADTLGRAMAKSTPVLDYPLGPHTTYRVGGSAAIFVELESRSDVVAAAETIAEADVPTLFVGRGSNLLVADRGFAGVALRLGAAFETHRIDGTTLVAGGAASLPVVARQSAAGGLTGFEWAVGVPGSIGGAVRMNAGGHGSDMAASLTEAIVVDFASGAERTLEPADLAFAYRSSSIEPHQVVIEATLQLAPGDRGRAEAEISEIVRWRREHQPGGQNAGSVFTNPSGDSAGRLIDSIGAKGLRIGSAEVSTKHANFIQADAGGSADDIAALMAELVERVHVATGIELHPETHMVGFDQSDVLPSSAPRISCEKEEPLS